MRRLIVDSFSPEARALRAHFDERLADPRSTRGDRFVWDYWHVPGQYTALRTPAWEFFPKALYSRFHNALVAWGRENLGCHDVSPPWMSNYVEGCRQELHGDVGHGPFAFVFSLTDWARREFRGGETMLLRDEILDLRRSPGRARWEAEGLEESGIIESIAPKFNRLTLFDPSIPHGVRRVEGTHDPRQGRLVIHGWFVNPRPYIKGRVSTAKVARALDALGAALPQLAGEGVQGWCVLRVRVGSGKNKASVLWQRLHGDDRARRALVATARQFLEQYDFGSAAGELTVPLRFDSA